MSERVEHRCRNLSELSFCPAILNWFVVEVDVDFAFDPLFDISELASIGEAIVRYRVGHAKDSADVVDEVVRDFVELDSLSEQTLVEAFADKR